MYTVGNVILGTHLPWSAEDSAKVAMAYVADDPTCIQDEGESKEHLMQMAACGELEWLELFADRDGWNEEYHGGASTAVAWVGVKLGEFDVTDHVAYKSMAAMIVGAKDRIAEATQKYMMLPKTVRDVLPPLDVYIVWSSS
jgi:hypothetical protein